MPGFRWGSFLGAIGQGEEQGQDVAERYRKMAEEQVARRAQDAVQNYLLGGPSQPAATPPTPTPMPAVPGAGMPPPGSPPGGPATAPGGGPPVAPLQSVAIPGAKPIAPPAPPPTMAPPPGPGAGAAPSPGGAGPPPGVNSPAPPPAPSGGGGGGLPPPGSPQTDDPIVQSKATLQAIAKEIAAANPGRKWGHGELLDAVSDVLGQMDKVNPYAKQIAQLQLQYYKANLGASEKDAALAERTRHDQAQESDRAGLLAERIRHEKATEVTGAQRASTYAEMAQFSHEDRQTAIAAANERASNAIDAKERMQAQKDADTMERLDKALEDKDWATVAQIQAGEYKAETVATGQAGQAPPVPRPRIVPPPRRTAGATAGRTTGSTPGYKSAGDVVAAYKAKKLTHDQASQILRQNGWAN